MNSLDCQPLCSQVDKDGSGELEFPEFIHLMARQMRDGVEDKEYREMFLMLSGGESPSRLLLMEPRAELQQTPPRHRMS